MPDPRINLKNPVLAGVLAFLLPGAGHLYQGRIFKSVVYAICIWGTYLTGNVLSGWRAIQAPRLAEVKTKIPLSLKFAAQSGVGLPSLYAMYQNTRASGADNRDVSSLAAPMEAKCSGKAAVRNPATGKTVEGVIDGSLQLTPTTNAFGKSIAGTFKGTYRVPGEEAAPVEWTLERVTLARRIQPGLKRPVRAAILDQPEGSTLGDFEGTIPRSFLDGFGAPATTAEEESLHGELGKFHELAMVLTWIAGLLNVLAIWDAIDGPAYGYGDETDKLATGNSPPTPGAPHNPPGPAQPAATS
jgi:hypothetical protein